MKGVLWIIRGFQVIADVMPKPLPHCSLGEPIPTTRRVDNNVEMLYGLQQKRDSAWNRRIRYHAGAFPAACVAVDNTVEVKT
jgi:hypothetical protein